MRLLDSVELVWEWGVQRSDGERVGTGRLVAEWFYGNVECLQRFVIDVVEEVPEKTEIKVCALGKIECTAKVLRQLRL